MYKITRYNGEQRARVPKADEMFHSLPVLVTAPMGFDHDTTFIFQIDQSVDSVIADFSVRCCLLR